MSSGVCPNGLTLTKRLITEVPANGLQNPDLVKMYETIETFIIGSTNFDAGGITSSFDLRTLNLLIDESERIVSPYK